MYIYSISKNLKMKNGSLIFVLLLTLGACASKTDAPNEENSNDFSFVFMTDIHLKPELRAPEGFQMAIDTVNVLQPDFVITGGDLIDDALKATYGRADTLYTLYKKMAEGFSMPVYNTMGNHEIYGYAIEEGLDPDHPEYGEKMFENRIGKRYYSFNHKGWHFMILDGIEKSEDNLGISRPDSSNGPDISAATVGTGGFSVLANVLEISVR